MCPSGALRVQTEPDGRASARPPGGDGTRTSSFIGATLYHFFPAGGATDQLEQRGLAAPSTGAFGFNYGLVQGGLAEFRSGQCSKTTQLSST